MGIATELELSTQIPNLTPPSCLIVSKRLHIALHKGLLQQVSSHIQRQMNSLLNIVSYFTHHRRSRTDAASLWIQWSSFLTIHKNCP